MLKLGDIVSHRNWPITPQPDVTIDQVFVADGVYYYRIDDCTNDIYGEFGTWLYNVEQQSLQRMQANYTLF